MNTADVLKRDLRSILTQIKAKSNVSEETTKDAKNYYIPYGSWLFQSDRLQSMIDLWLDDIIPASNTTNNQISQHPLESQPLSAKESDNKLKGEKKIFCCREAISREMNYFIRISYAD